MKKMNYNFIKMMKNEIMLLPTPMNINYLWNLGSMLGLCLIIQIMSGFILSMQYSPNINIAFNSIVHIMHNVNNGWIIRLIHMNGASMFFLCMFMHIGRGMYYNSYTFKYTWILGTLMFLLTMMSAFLGYILPWGQMSFWGATVITNLASAIPFIGDMIVSWVWGGFSINNATLNRFYSLHFIIPLSIIMLTLIHLMTLHSTGSSNPLGNNSNYYKIPFNSYFTIKDLLTASMMFMMLMLMCTLTPYMMGDPENFSTANPMITPIHIQPEWYFLFAYAILRSIPNKLGGVLALMMSVTMISFMPLNKLNKFKSSSFYMFSQIKFWLFINTFILLTWIGMKPIEYPYMKIGQILTVIYFLYFLMLKKNILMQNKMMF